MKKIGSYGLALVLETSSKTTAQLMDGKMLELVMGDLSKNISRHELKCRCGCGFDTVDIELVEVLQVTVNYFEREYKRDVRLDIVGGNRCRRYNDELRELYKSTNGNHGFNTAKNSQHIYARAADFKLAFRDTNKQIPPTEVYAYLNKHFEDEIALGLYINRCHVDVRTGAGQRLGLN